VGDSHVDHAAAKAAGCFGIAAAWGHMHPDVVDADGIAHTPRDVVDLLTLP
jgi:phosphoglycolate phosphatase-like HAD superfamily hydrolase